MEVGDLLEAMRAEIRLRVSAFNASALAAGVGTSDVLV